MTISIPYLTTEIEKTNHTVHLLIVNNNNFNIFNLKDIKENFHIPKSVKKDYKRNANLL